MTLFTQTELIQNVDEVQTVSHYWFKWRQNETETYGALSLLMKTEQGRLFVFGSCANELSIRQTRHSHTPRVQDTPDTNL